jgi:hypothetical protein
MPSDAGLAGRVPDKLNRVAANKDDARNLELMLLSGQSYRWLDRPHASVQTERSYNELGAMLDEGAPKLYDGPASEWLKETAGELRDERFAPIAWGSLSHACHHHLYELRPTRLDVVEEFADAAGAGDVIAAARIPRG